MEKMYHTQVKYNNYHHLLTFRDIIEVHEVEKEEEATQGAFLSTLENFNEKHLSIINEATGIRAVYQNDTRVYLASDELNGKFELRECNGNYQLKVKVSDVIERFRLAIEGKVKRDVGFYSKNPTPQFLYCFINTFNDGSLSVLKDTVESRLKLSDLRDRYFKTTVVLKSGLIKFDPLKKKYTWSLNVFGIKLVTPTEEEISSIKKNDFNSYGHGIRFCKAL